MGCVAVEIPITIYEGGTFDKTFQWRSGEIPAPVDLTGFSARMQIRAKLADASPILEVPFSVAEWTPDGVTGIYLPDGGLTGKYRIYLKDENTLGICAVHRDIAGVYDLFLVSPAGESILKQYGVAALVAAVTR